MREQRAVGLRRAPELGHRLEMPVERVGVHGSELDLPDDLVVQLRRQVLGLQALELGLRARLVDELLDEALVGLHRLGDRLGVHAAPLRDRLGVLPAPLGDGLRQLRPALTLEARDPEDLARSHVEVEGRRARGEGDALQREPRRRFLAVGAHGALVHVVGGVLLSAHHADEPLGRGLGLVDHSDEPAGSLHRRTVDEDLELVHAEAAKQ